MRRRHTKTANLPAISVTSLTAHNIYKLKKRCHFRRYFYAATIPEFTFLHTIASSLAGVITAGCH
ncbi:hypothetical protein [Adhaeribacter aerolatus]|uniref:hypothetical protein n=1 Tax=Adhaeribacter aerolatus TaxID=670289 RepID=UPI0011BE0585|nr:hypothetical protein [Adhaeribacter aerolatus]